MRKNDENITAKCDFLFIQVMVYYIVCTSFDPDIRGINKLIV
jgi:hypothetical protein